MRTSASPSGGDTASVMIHQLQAVLDAAVDAVVVVDHRGRILLANRATERLFGWSIADLQDRDVGMLMAEPHRSAHAGYIERYLQTGEARVIGIGRDVQAQHRDGHRFAVRLSIGQIAGVDPPRFVGFIHDLTEQMRQAEDALRLNQRLMQVSRMATMGEMAAGFAHEVNQPLTAISNYALAAGRFLASGQPDISEARQALHEIAAEAQRAGEIIRRLRRMVQDTNEDREITLVPSLIDELRTLCLADARANDTGVRFTMPPDLPPLLIHRVQIAQALLNLLRNALEALARDPPGGRMIVVDGRRNHRGDCEITISDNGPGVAPQILDWMFEPFHSTKPNGAGLGLPMSRTIAQAHGGSLRHEPTLPRGARFILTVPAAAGAP